MTSKEALKLIYKGLCITRNITFGFNDIDDVFLNDEEKEAYKIVLEDLEVLEVLKKNIDLQTILNTLNDEEDAEKLSAFLDRDN